MPTLYPCSNCGTLFQRSGKATRCNTCAPYGWPADRPKMPDGWSKRRAQKLEANPTCEACGQRRATTVDHIIARAFGGTEGWANLRSLCPGCARMKDAADRERGRTLKRGGEGSRRDR